MTKASKTQAPSHQPAQGFSYSREHFASLVDAALLHAKKLGATDAGADASEGCGLSVSVRKGELENVERNRDKSLGVTVYVGHRRGNASTSDFSQDAIERTVQAAFDIARFTAEDPVAGLPDEKDIAQHHPDLDLFHPWPITSADAATIALRCEAAAMQTDKRIQQRRRSGVGAAKPFFQCPYPRFSWWLRQLAPHHFGCPHRWQRRRHAARRLVQLHA
jgi:PmbA protein